MSDNFTNNCYTSRSSGYKYRTLSTNTGVRKRRDSKEDSAFDRKFNELRREITSRIDNQVEKTQQARDHIREKLEKMDSKINSMIELHNTVQSLRKDLHVADDKLSGLLDKVEKIESRATGSEVFSLQSRKSLFRRAPICEEDEVLISDKQRNVSC